MSIHSLAQNWRLIALRGLLAVLYSVAVFAWPNLAITTLMLIFAAYLVMDAVPAIVAGLTRFEGSQPWWLLLVEGAAGILAAFVIILVHGWAASTVLPLIAAWAVITGMVKLISAIRVRVDIPREGFLASTGIASAAFGILLVIWRDPGTVGLIWITGTYAVLSGLLLSGFAFQLWNWHTMAHRVLRPVWVGPRQHPRRSLEK